MNLSSSSIFQWMFHDYQDQKPAEILFLRPGRKAKPSYGGAWATKQYECRACVAQQATETVCTKKSIQRSLSSERGNIDEQIGFKQQTGKSVPTWHREMGF